MPSTDEPSRRRLRSALRGWRGAVGWDARSGPRGNRVAQVAAFFPPRLGGVERVVDSLSQALAQEGADVEVLTTAVDSHGAPTREQRDGMRIVRHRALHVAHTPLAPGLFVSVLRQPRGTLVHVHVAHAAVAELVRLACWLRGFRYVAHLHLDVGPSSWVGRLLLSHYKRWVLGPAMRGAARVVTLSPEMADFVVTSYAVPRERVSVVPNGVDARFFEQDDGDVGRPLRRPLRVLSASRLVVQKNLPRLLHALAPLEVPTEVVVAGDGDQRQLVEGLADRLGLDQVVRFVGPQDGEEIAKWLGWSDVLALSSDHEGMPLVALEAMAAGVPVVATDVPGTHELVEDVGLLVPATEEGLSAGLEQVALDPDLRQDLAERGRRRAAEHTWSDVAEMVLEEYEQAWPQGGRSES